MKYILALLTLCITSGCAKNPAMPKAPAPPDLVYLKGSCILGALVSAKSCELVKVDKIGPVLDCRVLIKPNELACLPAPKAVK